MMVESGDINSVTLLPLNLTMKQPLDMTLFTVTNYVLVNASASANGSEEGIRIQRPKMTQQPINLWEVKNFPIL